MQEETEGGMEENRWEKRGGVGKRKEEIRGRKKVVNQKKKGGGVNERRVEWKERKSRKRGERKKIGKDKK